MSLRTLPKEEHIFAGTAACPGCGEVLSLRLVLKSLGRKTILVIPAGCTSIIQGIAPFTSIGVPVINVAFAAAAATASGVVQGLEATEVTGVRVVVWAGDGGTADIGIQALSGAAERQTDILYLCCDNESYMNTGIQRSSSTPLGAWTTTTPTGKKEPKKEMPFIMAAHRIPYVATACPSYPTDLIEKVETAKEMRRTRYVQILSPCPSGWRFPSEKTIEIGRLAVETGMWPLYTFQYGIFKLSPTSERLLDPSKRRPVREYLALQGRFAHFTESEFADIQSIVSSTWRYLAQINDRRLFEDGWIS